jgi:heptosyltransferase III
MKNIILSRTDSIGDVVLTLPLAGVLKNRFPGCHITFLGNSYTRPLIEACSNIDEFLDKDMICGKADPSAGTEILRAQNADVMIHVFPVKEICYLAKKAGIPLRIATSHRWFTWLYCNRRIHFSRKNSDLHEAQLNLKLLEPLGITDVISTGQIPGLYGLKQPVDDLPAQLSSKISADKFNLILHPKSKGSAREWGLDNFSTLIRLLPEEKFRIFITGTKEEGEKMSDFLSENESRIIDLTGKMTLEELIVFIGRCDGMVAASTGPLHIAAALGKQAIGLYAPMRPIFPKRWSPLGTNADWLVVDKTCEKCRHTGDCECIRAIKPEEVVRKMLKC